MLEIGMKIKTNYSDESCTITGIDRGCTCPSYLDEIEMDDPPDRREHIHLELVNGAGQKRWLNGYDENTLLSIEQSYCGGKAHLDYDRIIILPNDRPFQPGLFR